MKIPFRSVAFVVLVGLVMLTACTRRDDPTKPKADNTPVPPTATTTFTGTASNSPTSTASLTSTGTPTWTPTWTETFTSSPTPIPQLIYAFYTDSDQANNLYYLDASGVTYNLGPSGNWSALGPTSGNYYVRMEIPSIVSCGFCGGYFYYQLVVTYGGVTICGNSQINPFYGPMVCSGSIGIPASTPTPNGTPSPTPTPTGSPTLTLTDTTTPSVTNTPTISDTPTESFTPTNSPTPTDSPTVTPTFFSTPCPTLGTVGDTAYVNQATYTCNRLAVAVTVTKYIYATEIQAYGGDSSNNQTTSVSFGIYTDGPGTLLTSGDSGGVLAGGVWNVIPITPVFLTPGVYWIVTGPDVAGKAYGFRANNDNSNSMSSTGSCTITGLPPDNGFTPAGGTYIRPDIVIGYESCY